MRCIHATLLACLMAPLPALAQQRVVVVPEGADVVVPARGASGPRLVNAPRPRLPAPQGRSAVSTSRPVLESGGGSSLGGATGLAAPALILPLIAAAAFAATSVPGSGSSTSAPARTR